MNIFSIELFSELNARNIQYAVLRNYKGLPNDLGGSDLDLWVSAADYSECTEILSNVAVKTKSVLASYTEDANCPKLCYLNKTCGIQIDLFKGTIICKDQVMFDEESIKRNVKVYNGIKILDDDIANVMAFLKEVLNNGKCKSKYFSPLSENKDVFTTEYLEKELKCFDREFCSLLASTISSGRYEDAFAEIMHRGRKCLGIKGNGSFLAQIKKLSRFMKPTGYTIALLGTDGSGKSYVIDKITPILNETFHNGIKYEHMRPNHLPSLAVATGKKKASNEEHTVCSDPHGSKPSGLIGSIVRLTYYWLDYTWGYFRKVYVDKSTKTHIWFFDRYYYDYYMDQRRARLNMPSWIIKFYGWFVPSPDLTICLGGDPAKIYARKPETSLDEVSRQTALLESFAKKHKNTVFVDTTITPEHSIDVTMDAIVRMMSKRFAK